MEKRIAVLMLLCLLCGAAMAEASPRILIYTHVRDEMLKKATVNMNEVFQQRTED